MMRALVLGRINMAANEIRGKTANFVLNVQFGEKFRQF